jgi:hypothetical protein
VGGAFSSVITPWIENVETNSDVMIEIAGQIT